MCFVLCLGVFNSYAALSERGVFAEGGRKSLPAVQKAAVAAMGNNYLRKAINAAIEIYKVRLGSCKEWNLSDHAVPCSR
jgi:hypothetical protein